MNKSHFQWVVGFVWFFAQIGIIVYLFVLYAKGGFLFDEVTTTASIVGPLFLSFTAAFVALIIESNKHDNSTERVSFVFVLFTTVVVVAFVAALFELIHQKAWGNFLDFDKFKLSVGMLQTFIGVYVGAVLGHLFGHSGKRPADGSAEQQK